jgi:hypothetical protein
VLGGRKATPYDHSVQLAGPLPAYLLVFPDKETTKVAILFDEHIAANSKCVWQEPNLCTIPTSTSGTGCAWNALTFA